MEIEAPDGPDISNAGTMMRTIWTLYGITLAIVLLRLYTQWRVTKSLGLGDAMMASSIVCGTGILITLTIQHQYGLGRHFFYLDQHQRVMALKYNFSGQPLGIMAATFGRNASCVMMLQLFGTNKTRRWILWITFWQSLFVNLLTIILIFVQCHDIRSLWDPLKYPSYCWSPNVQEITGFVQGGINSATDLFLTLLPIRIFWTLKMSRRLKCGLVFLLGLSGFAFVASIIKTAELKAIGDRGDFTFGTVDFFTWVVVEWTLVDIAASVPLILPLVRRWGKAPPTNTYELKRTPGHSLNISGATARKKRTLGQTEQEMRAGSLSESAENILQSEERGVALKQGLERADSFDEDVEALAGVGGGLDVEIESGKDTEISVGVVHVGLGEIVKQTGYDVSYDQMQDETGAARREMWITKELQKIPWEVQNSRERAKDLIERSGSMGSGTSSVTVIKAGSLSLKRESRGGRR